MISIQPKWVEKIINGEKTIEIRKTMPKCEFPIDVYIYCTKDPKHLVAPFRFKQGWIYKEYNDETYYSRGCTANVGDDINGKVVAKFTLNKTSKIYANRQGCGRLNNPEDFEYFYSLGLIASDKNPNLYSQDYGVKTEKWSCLSQEELHKYLKYKDGYAWHIDNLEIFDKPKELSEFKKFNTLINDYGFGAFVRGEKMYVPLTKAPQSWQFVEVEE